MKAFAAGTVTFLALAVALVSLAWAPETELSPITPEGAFRWIFAGSLIIALVAYFAGATFASGRAGLAAATVLAIAIQLAPLAAPLLLSTDAYTYWAYGRVGAVHRQNPYEDTPDAFPGDPAFPRMGADWRDTPSLYGPVFTLGAEVHAAVVGDRPGLAARAYKALAGLLVVAIALMAGRLAREPSRAIAFVGWNPLLALHFAGGGHNDAWMLAAVLAAISLAAAGRRHASGVLWALSIGIKWVPLVLLPLELLARRRRVGLAGLAAGSLLVALVASLRYGAAWLSAAGGGLSRQARSTGSVGLSGILGDAGLGHRQILVVLALGFALGYAFLLREALRGRARLGLGGGLFALAQGWLNPWYALWPVALSAIEEDRAARLLAFALTAYLLADALPL